VFAASFYATLGAVKAINALELGFPRKVSLLGFEHSEWMTAVRPYISAVEQSVDDLAKRSWDTLRDRMAGHASGPKRILLDLQLVLRESTRPPGSAARGSATRSVSRAARSDTGAKDRRQGTTPAAGK
jgi:LacI family transcriptional regulator